MLKLSQESGQLCKGVVGVSILRISTIFQLDFVTVPTLPHFFVFYFIKTIVQ